MPARTLAKSADLDIPRLCDAIRAARRALRPFRNKRREAVKLYAGARWGEYAADKEQPVNLLSLFISAYSRSLVPKNPRVMLSTFVRDLKPVVSAMQAAVNLEVEAMRLDKTLRRVVVDALFSGGILKVALATPADAAVSGWGLKAGAPYACPVDLDDWVYDVFARDFCEAWYVGHRYRVPIDLVKDSKYYSSARKKLEPSRPQYANKDGDEKIEIMGRGQMGGDTEAVDMVDLWEIYLPQHRLVLTLADDLVGGTDSDPLREQNWIGPDDGPFHYLGYGTIPGNAMPKAPVQDLVCLHETVNNLARKLIEQGRRQKELLLVGGGAAEDGSRVVNASDGEAIRVDNPEAAQVAGYGGPSEKNFALFVQMRDLFKEMGGNLDSLAGLNPQAKTLGQDRLLQASSSKLMGDLQEETIDFTAKVCKALCWYWWHDPFRSYTSEYSPKGLPAAAIQRTVGPEQRQKGRFEDLAVRVDPFSLQHSTPEGRLQFLNQVMGQLVVPLMPLLVQQGIHLDMQTLIKKFGEYADQPDLDEILTIAAPPQDPAGGPAMGQVQGKPAQTERRYVRENVPGRTQKGNDMNLASSLMGVNPGGAQQANGQPRQAG